MSENTGLTGRRLPCAAWIGAASLLALTGCATIIVPEEERLLTLGAEGQVAATTRSCAQPRQAVPPESRAAAPADALDASTLRIASWNMKKGEEPGWQADLARYADDHDLLLLQEAVMTPQVRHIIEGAGLRWQMAGAFAQGGEERGVLVAARATPLDGCTLRAFEPLFPVPKSAMVVRYRLAGRAQPLAVANLHGINFTLGLTRFREQIEAVAAELARHEGPMVLAGDFNTWSQERHELLEEVATRLGLKAVTFEPDGRIRALGMHLDHLFVRGLAVLRAMVPRVTSSDHNPILVRLSAQ